MARFRANGHKRNSTRPSHCGPVVICRAVKDEEEAVKVIRGINSRTRYENREKREQKKYRDKRNGVSLPCLSFMSKPFTEDGA